MSARPWRDRELVARLAGAARLELEACVRHLGPIRPVGARERWDAAIVERVAARPACRAARAWGRATELWWRLALTAETLAGAEARRHAPGLRSTSLSVEDLRSGGLMGAYRAAQTWDPEAGSTWPPYVSHAIVGQIRRDLQRARSVSARQQEVRLDLLRAMDHLGASAEEAAAWLERDPVEAALLVEAQEVGLDEEDSSFDPVPQLMLAWDAARLRAMLSRLRDRERAVLEARCAGRSTQEIGAALGVSGARVRQIERRGRERLRELMAS